MQLTYSHIFEVRLKSIKFDEKIINIVVLTIFYSHIIRIFQEFVLIACFACLFEAFKCCLVTIEKKV